jgi:hypothetical protein
VPFFGFGVAEGDGLAFGFGAVRHQLVSVTFVDSDLSAACAVAKSG